MSHGIAESVYRVVGNKLFEKISLSDNKIKTPQGSRVEAKKKILELLKGSEKGVTQVELIKAIDVSRTSVQTCVRLLLGEKLIKKIPAPTVTNKRTVAYVWVGEV